MPDVFILPALQAHNTKRPFKEAAVKLANHANNALRTPVIGVKLHVIKLKCDSDEQE